MELRQQLVTQLRVELKPLLIQAVRLLPLSQLELRHKLLQEYLQNPLLELRSLEDLPSVESLYRPSREDVSGDDDAWLQGILNDPTYEMGFPGERGDGQESTSQDWIWERWISSPVTLVDHLRWQIAMLPVDEEIRQVCYFLIEFLNPAGYLEEPPEELAELAGVTPEMIESARHHLMRLDPPGVGARGLRECLMVQLEVAGHADSCAYTLLQKAWSELIRQDLKAAQQVVGCDDLDFQKALDLLHQLEPSPGRSFVPHQLLYIYPDVIVRKEDDAYTIELSRDLLPRLAISRRYIKMLKSGQLSPEEKAYVREKVLSARRLLKTLVYCESTLQRVARFIVDHQRDFLDQGLPGLRPLTLREVAQALDLHESTISRTVQHKYIQTPRGTFEMRFFFQRRLPTRGRAGGVSTTVVRLRLKELIESEEPQRPLTDDALARLLRLEGIQISRRAVTKYRLEMGIPNARQRAHRAKS